MPDAACHGLLPDAWCVEHITEMIRVRRAVKSGTHMQPTARCMVPSPVLGVIISSLAVAAAAGACLLQRRQLHGPHASGRPVPCPAPQPASQSASAMRCSWQRHAWVALPLCLAWLACQLSHTSGWASWPMCYCYCCCCCNCNCYCYCYKNNPTGRTKQPCQPGSYRTKRALSWCNCIVWW